jgi:hypothetical protein
MAMASQGATVMFLFLAMYIHASTTLETLQELDGSTDNSWLHLVFGFNSPNSLATAMIVTLSTFLVVFIVVALYQAIMSPNAAILRNQRNGHPPLLGLSKGKRYHLFLSHGLSG